MAASTWQQWKDSLKKVIRQWKGMGRAGERQEEKERNSNGKRQRKKAMERQPASTWQ